MSTSAACEFYRKLPSARSQTTTRHLFSLLRHFGHGHPVGDPVIRLDIKNRTPGSIRGYKSLMDLRQRLFFRDMYKHRNERLRQPLFHADPLRLGGFKAFYESSFVLKLIAFSRIPLPRDLIELRGQGFDEVGGFMQCGMYYMRKINAVIYKYLFSHHHSSPVLLPVRVYYYIITIE